MGETPPGGQQIRIDHLSKHFGPVQAVDDLSFTVQPGSITGFLGPNGAGKTTTLRTLLGLVSASSGTATIGGLRYQDITEPAQTVGACLEASSFHPGRTARQHLKVMSLAAGISDSRGDEVLELVALSEAGERRVGTFSLGMRQRLALAGALLGDPPVLVLDEPANGLDPEGIAWLRTFLRHLAAEGRTVLVSSHVLAEVEQTVDDVVIMAKGRLVRACPLEELVTTQVAHVLVRGPHIETLLEALLAGADGRRPTSVRRADDDALAVQGLAMATVGSIAHSIGAELHELREERTDLEDIFLELTSDGAA